MEGAPLRLFIRISIVIARFSAPHLPISAIRGLIAYSAVSLIVTQPPLHEP